MWDVAAWILSCKANALGESVTFLHPLLNSLHVIRPRTCPNCNYNVPLSARGRPRTCPDTYYLPHASFGEVPSSLMAWVRVLGFPSQVLVLSTYHNCLRDWVKGRGITRKLERRGDVAIGCTYSRCQSATLSEALFAWERAKPTHANADPVTDEDCNSA